MQNFKRLFIASLVAFAPVASYAATAAAPAPAASAPAAAATTAAPAGAAPAAAAHAAPAAAAAPGAASSMVGQTVDTSVGAPANPAYVENGFAYARPVEGVGQPIPGGYDFQPQATETGRHALWFSNAILLPLITLICLLVLGLLLWVMVRYRRGANPEASRTTHNTFIEVVWTLIPVLILVGVAVPSIDLLARQYTPAPRDALTIKVTGYQWYWGYEYPDQGISEFVSNMLPEETANARGEPFHLAADNRMVIPAGRTVKLIITGSDVIHSFAVPSFWTKMDAVPGRLNEVTFRADTPGVYYGQCSELCGINHGYMPIAVEVVTPERFARWVASKGGHMTAPAAAATTTPASATTAAAPAATTAAAPAAAPATPAAAPAAAH